MIKLAEELGENSGQPAIIERSCEVVELGKLDSSTGLITYQLFKSLYALIFIIYNMKRLYFIVRKVSYSKI